MISARTRSRMWLWWSMLWNRRPLGRARWPHALRCDGYRPGGNDLEGYRTHMAQYCVRWAHHRGRCLAPIDYHGRDGDSEFIALAGGPLAAQARAYYDRINNPPVAERDWREDPCRACGRSGTCNIVFCYHEEDSGR